MAEETKDPLAVIADAIANAALTMPSLAKENRNAHGGYNYVSIDDYFEKCAKVAHGHGLSWAVRQTKLDIVSDVAGTKPFMVGSFEFDLIHYSGSTIRAFFTTYVTHPIQGAQTAGSMLAYATKMFLRMTFSVVTGEEDADATDPQSYTVPASMERDPFAHSAPQNAVPVYPVATQLTVVPDGEIKAPLIYDLTVAWLEDCVDIPALENYWRENTATFELVKKENPGIYSKLVKAFKDRRAAINQETANAV